MGDSYPKLPMNSVNRLRNRANYEYEVIHKLVNSVPVVHVAFVPDPNSPFPANLPMIGQMGCFETSDSSMDAPMDCYLHGSISSRIMKLSQEAVARGDEGIPMCITATKVDGLVLALTPFHHSYNFRSAVLYGHACVVEDEREKLWAMELITNKVVPGRWQNTRTPPNKTEMQSTNILRVKISSASAKLRSGVPNGDRNDLKDESVLNKYWSGVVPQWEIFGDPIPGPQNQVSKVPDHIQKYISSSNMINKSDAIDATKEV